MLVLFKTKEKIIKKKVVSISLDKWHETKCKSVYKLETKKTKINTL